MFWMEDEKKSVEKERKLIHMGQEAPVINSQGAERMLSNHDNSVILGCRVGFLGENSFYSLISVASGKLAATSTHPPKLVFTLSPDFSIKGLQVVQRASLQHILRFYTCQT